MVRDVVVLLRPKQWVKNAFIAVPFFFGFKLDAAGPFLHMLQGIAFFCLISSLVYVFNDLRDREADARHARKRLRPLASGSVSNRAAIGILVGLAVLIATMAATIRFPPEFLVVGAVYVALNIAYSMGLKAIPILELFFVAAGFVLRLYAGAFVAQVELTTWIVACTGLLSLMLATGKRRSDIVQGMDGEGGRRSLAYYTVAFLDTLNVIFATGAVMTYMLFAMSDYAQGRFSHFVPATSLFVIYGICRYLYLATVRGDGHDPTELVLSDNGIRICVAGFVACYAILIYWHHG